LILQKGYAKKTDCTNSAEPTKPTTPTPYHDIQIYGEVAFIQKVNLNAQPSNIMVTGRIDHGIGRVIDGLSDSVKRRFQTLLLIIEAKTKDNLPKAFAQLLTYLAALRQARMHRQRPDLSVYGLATDGYKYQFVMIDHDGVVKTSAVFDVNVRPEDLLVVLGGLMHIIKITSDRSPNTSPKGKKLIAKEANTTEDCIDYDPEVDVDESTYLKVEEEEEDDFEEESDDD